MVPGHDMEAIQGNLYCCGQAGVMGFKEEFHTASLELGSSLMREIERRNPESLLTDCLSCRLQFSQELLCPVKHPIELLADSYRRGSGEQPGGISEPL